MLSLTPSATDPLEQIALYYSVRKYYVTFISMITLVQHLLNEDQIFYLTDVEDLEFQHVLLHT